MRQSQSTPNQPVPATFAVPFRVVNPTTGQPVLEVNAREDGT